MIFINLERQTASQDGNVAQLSDNEARLLYTLAMQEVTTYEEAIAGVWGSTRNYAPSHLFDLMFMLRKRLSEAGIVFNVQAVRGVGYRVQEDL